jgi:hypothetical protein
VAGRPSETLGKSFCIAVIAACANLRAASDGIPRGIRPFDRGAVRHLPLQSATDESYTYSGDQWVNFGSAKADALSGFQKEEAAERTRRQPGAY